MVDAAALERRPVIQEAVLAAPNFGVQRPRSAQRLHNRLPTVSAVSTYDWTVYLRRRARSLSRALSDLMKHFIVSKLDQGIASLPEIQRVSVRFTVATVHQ